MAIKKTGFPGLDADNDATKLFHGDGTWAAPTEQGVPCGSIQPWTTDTAPDGWLLCYGQAVSRTTYSDLFAVISTTFGTGDGSTTFNLPDLRGRFPLGQDDMGGSSANRVTDAAADLLGGSDGQESYNLVANNIPTHTHAIGGSTGNDSPDHAHTYYGLSGSGGGAAGGSWAQVAQSTGGASTRHTHSLPANTGNNTTTGTAINLMNPYLTLNYIIKYVKGVAFESISAGTGIALSEEGVVSVVSAVDNALCQGRLTLTSGTAVTTSDVTGATNIYFTPFRGNRIALYDGANWNIRTFTEITIALGELTNGKPYDLFAYDNAGTVTFDAPVAWTDDTTRATALVLQDGVWCKSGDTTRRYIGSFYTTATTTTEDSETKRYLFNAYNRVFRKLKVTEATNSWNYTTATWRQARGSSANQVNVIVGLNEDLIELSVNVMTLNSTYDTGAYVGIGIDATNANSSDVNLGTVSASVPTFPFAHWKGYTGVGRHYLAWLEYSMEYGTTTWYGDNGGTITLTGMVGSCMS